jgi:hypothetical protein
VQPQPQQQAAPRQATPAAQPGRSSGRDRN